VKALALLQECVVLDEGFDPRDDPRFVSLKNDPAFRQLVEQVRRRYPPVHRTHVVFTLAQKDLFPEGLAVDTAKRLFYMSNMHLKKIVKITETRAVKSQRPSPSEKDPLKWRTAPFRVIGRAISCAAQGTVISRPWWNAIRVLPRW
jgi:hypothetical protein